MNPLPDVELERVQEAVAARLELPRTEFLDRLIFRCLERHPDVLAREDELREAFDPENPPPDDATISTLAELGGLAPVAGWVGDELTEAKASPWFEPARRVAELRDSAAFEQLISSLDSELRLRGLLYRHGLDPDLEAPGLWGRIWEAIPKWDGRDFRAYVARIVRNHCLDEIARKKRAPHSIEDNEPRERRPVGQTTQRVATREALGLVDEVLAEMEASGRIKPTDFVIFGLVCQGRQVADVQAAFAGPALPAVSRALEALGPKGGKCGAGEAVAIGLLLDELSAAEVAAITGRAPAGLEAAARALAPLEDEDRELARTAAREGMTLTELSRAVRLTANALNLILNRIRLKLWMALVDRAYEAMRRRGRVDEVELRIVQHRCTMPTHAGCRMYKDRTCKREAPLEDIARLGGLDLSPRALGRRMEELREKLIEEGFGRGFPDYNACLNERKPGSRGGK